MIPIENPPPSSDLHITEDSIPSSSKTGSKISTSLGNLIAAPELINPALAMCRKIQHLELTGELDNRKMNELSSEIETAIDIGTKFSSDVRATIDLLRKCQPVAQLIPEGF